LSITLQKVSKTNGETLTGEDISKIDSNTDIIEHTLNNLPSTGSTIRISTINGNIKIDGTESVVYTHPTSTSATNPHNTTSSDVNLGNVTNESKTTMFTNPIFAGSVTEGNGTYAYSGKMYTIVAYDDTNKTLTLDSSDGILVNDNIDVKINTINPSILLNIQITNISGNIITINTTNSINNFWKYAIKRTTNTYPPHAEGFSTIAISSGAHAEGRATIANGNFAHVQGISTTANVYCSHVIGQYNKNLIGSSTSFATTNDAFVVGNGISSSNLSNAFRITFDGSTYGLAFNSSGADLAEWSEWLDGNLDKEDRVGYFVTTIGKKIKKATENDCIYGVISGNPCLVGNSDNNDWSGKYLKDNFNRIIYEDIEEEIEQINEETYVATYVKTGNIIKRGRMKLNPEYDSTKEYISRVDRSEWDYVGKRGMISVRDDGTCIVNNWCKCNKDGLATLSTERNFDTFMVLERITDNTVLIEFR